MSVHFSRNRFEDELTPIFFDNVMVRLNIGNLCFDNLIEVEGAGEEAFSAGGDSGSLIVGKRPSGRGAAFPGRRCWRNERQGADLRKPHPCRPGKSFIRVGSRRGGRYPATAGGAQRERLADGKDAVRKRGY